MINSSRAGLGWLATLPDDLRQALSLVGGLRSYLRHPVSVSEARTILATRLRTRESEFIRLMAHAVYAVEDSPYHSLLRHAGCELGDLEQLVAREGVEGALRALFRAGVYLTVDEFKGREAAVRAGLAVPVDAGRLRNPLVVPALMIRSSGSRGPATTIPLHLGILADRAVNTCLALAARGGAEWRKGVWSDPGGSPGLTLRFSGFGQPAERCFALVATDATDLHPRYRWSMPVIRASGRLLAGIRLPMPEHVALDAPLPIARWMAEVRSAGATPHLWTFVSPALRLCAAALDAGLDISGSQLTVTGEPLTAARLQLMRQAGTVPVPDYGTAESGFIAHGCLVPSAPDDMHVMHDLNTVVQVGPGEARPHLPAGALLVSTLRTSAPLVHLNVSLGDVATLESRTCGCGLEALGWTTHVAAVRSYEKLTAAGMTFLDRDVVRVLEEVLPHRFGGRPNDYQLVEDDAEDGQPRLRLLVHPLVGPLDANAVVEVFLDALGADRAVRRVMSTVWRDARVVRVERRPPLTTRTGKVLHLHRAGKGRASPADSAH